jgi:8-oxo-dGTP diphosphatase
MAGLWEFPGGKIESGESPQGALVRELREELGIGAIESDLEAFTFASHAYENFHLLMPVFLIRKWEGEIDPREGQKLAWVSADEIRRYPAPAADLPLFERFIDWTKAGRS